MKTTLRRSILTACTLAALACPALAEDNYWTNANGTSRWVESGNWSLGRVPNSGDNAIIAWGPNTTSVIIDGFAHCANFTNANNQTIISNNGYLRVWGTGYIGGGLFIYGTAPVLETMGNTSIYNSALLYNGALRQAPGATLTFETGSSAIIPEGWGGVSVEGGTVVNRGFWSINNGGFSLGKYNDTDPLTFFENAFGGTLRFYRPGSIFDPSNGNHNGGNSVLINRGLVEAPTSGYNVIEGDIQYWALDFGATVARGDAYIDIRNPINLSVSGTLDRCTWSAFDNGAIVFGGGGRSITEIGSGATVYMDGPNAHVYGVDQVVSIRGTLAVYGGKQLLLQPPVGVTQHSGQIQVGSGSSITLLQAFAQQGGTIRREVNSAADMQTPALNCAMAANVYGGTYLHFVNPALAVPNSLYKIVSGGWGVGGGFNSVTASIGGTFSGFYTNNDAYARVVPPCQGDLNADGSINTADLVMFLGQFGTTRPERFDGADFSGDFQVDTSDLVFFLGRFGTSC